MHTIRALLASESLTILTIAVFGLIQPHAVAFALTQHRLTGPVPALTGLFVVALVLALAQVTSLDRSSGAVLRGFLQVRLFVDFALALMIVQLGLFGPLMLGVISLTLVYSATRVYGLTILDAGDLPARAPLFA